MKNVKGNKNKNKFQSETMNFGSDKARQGKCIGQLKLEIYFLSLVT